MLVLANTETGQSKTFNNYEKLYRYLQNELKIEDKMTDEVVKQKVQKDVKSLVNQIQGFFQTILEEYGIEDEQSEPKFSIDEVVRPVCSKPEETDEEWSKRHDESWKKIEQMKEEIKNGIPAKDIFEKNPYLIDKSKVQKQENNKEITMTPICIVSEPKQKKNESQENLFEQRLKEMKKELNRPEKEIEDRKESYERTISSWKDEIKNGVDTNIKAGGFTTEPYNKNELSYESLIPNNLIMTEKPEPKKENNLNECDQRIDELLENLSKMGDDYDKRNLGDLIKKMKELHKTSKPLVLSTEKENIDKVELSNRTKLIPVNSEHISSIQNELPLLTEITHNNPNAYFHPFQPSAQELRSTPLTKWDNRHIFNVSSRVIVANPAIQNMSEECNDTYFEPENKKDEEDDDESVSTLVPVFRNSSEFYDKKWDDTKKFSTYDWKNEEKIKKDIPELVIWFLDKFNSSKDNIINKGKLLENKIMGEFDNCFKLFLVNPDFAQPGIKEKIPQEFHYLLLEVQIHLYKQMMTFLF